jgi:hypothetical protein
VQLDLCAQPTTTPVGEPVRFEGSATPCAGTIDFGDGSSAVVEPGGTQTLSHAFREPGRYRVRFTAADCGPGGEIALTVTVS